MIKPDYIPFSQEIFDECEVLRVRTRSGGEYIKTKEYSESAMKLFEFIMSEEYGRYLNELDKRKV